MQFRPQIGTPEGWLVAHVRGRAIDLMRRRHRDGLPLEIFSREIDLDAGLARMSTTADSARLAAALETLDTSSREILVLAFLDGLSAGEIAQRLRLPIGTVKSRSHDTLAHLRAVLEPVA